MSKHELLLSMLKCPDCQSDRLDAGNGRELVCTGCGARYPVIRSRPVLLRASNRIFSIGDYSEEKTRKKTGGISRFIPTPSVNLSSTRMLQQLSAWLAGQSSAKVLVVGSGGQRQWLDALLKSGDAIEIFHSDIDVGADVDLFCDGHDLPFVDGVFDAIVTTAVLEHVLYPERVVEEMRRVLKPEGRIYSELPFMQQVHEGAYDFSRYTLSGHRRLMNGFSEIESGMVAGPATALVWAIENFVLAFISGRKLRLVAKAGVRCLFFWLKYLDLLLAQRQEALDGASCTYFYGSRTEVRVPDLEIIHGYRGAQHLRHT